MRIAVAGAGAFGGALAITLARAGRTVTLLARSEAEAAPIRESRALPRLPGHVLPDGMAVSGNPGDLGQHDIVLLCVPMQALRGYLAAHRDALTGPALVACCKGIDLERLTGPTGLIAEGIGGMPAILTGPSFAADIATGLPTALTLACAERPRGEELQAALSTPALRLYRSADPLGAELGGALKNVVAIACGAAIGAGLGDSARAALMTRGFAEMRRLAARLGADPDTLTGLSGFGDLALTCTSAQSRNFRFGHALGEGEAPRRGDTVEGQATATAVARLAADLGEDLPVHAAVAELVAGDITVVEALRGLLARPLRAE